MLPGSDNDCSDDESIMPGSATTAALSCPPRTTTLVPCLRDHGSTLLESVTQAPGLKCYLDNRSNMPG